MNKAMKLKLCDRSLLILTIAILISGIQLEATDSSGLSSVWIHIIVAMLFVGIAAYHVFLHFSHDNWFSRIRRQKSLPTRVLWWVSLITLITGIAATAHWLVTFRHAPIGGVHGKLGFLMILLSSAHIIKRRQFFKRK